MTSIMAEPPKKGRERASLRAYVAGRRAFQDGRTIDENPYAEGRNTSERREWFDGFVCARTDDRIGHILEKYP